MKLIDKLKRALFENTPRVYRIERGVMIRWHDREYIIILKDY